MLQEAKHQQAKCSQKGQAITYKKATPAVPVVILAQLSFSCGPVEQFLRQGLALCCAAVQAESETESWDCSRSCAAADACSQKLASGTASFQLARCSVIAPAASVEQAASVLDLQIGWYLGPWL